MSSVHLHIARIVVEGMPRKDGRRLAIALEEKLRQWAESGIAGAAAGSTPHTIPSLNAGRLRPGATPSQAAGQIVQAIQARLSAPAAPGPDRQTGSRHV
jgi:hypothetical protein